MGWQTSNPLVILYVGDSADLLGALHGTLLKTVFDFCRWGKVRDVVVGYLTSVVVVPELGF